MTSFHFSLSCIGEGNGNPLQCSCLQNPRDWGAWWAAVSGVAQSRTRLKRLSSSSSKGKILNTWADTHLPLLCLFKCYVLSATFLSPKFNFVRPPWPFNALMSKETPFFISLDLSEQEHGQARAMAVFLGLTLSLYPQLG